MAGVTINIIDNVTTYNDIVKAIPAIPPMTFDTMYKVRKILELIRVNIIHPLGIIGGIITLLVLRRPALK